MVIPIRSLESGAEIQIWRHYILLGIKVSGSSRGNLLALTRSHYAIDSTLRRVRCARKPCVRVWRFFGIILNTRIFSSLKLSTTVNVTFDPTTVGVPIWTDFPSASARSIAGRSNVEPTSRFWLSTSNVWPFSTVCCFPPISTIAIMINRVMLI